MQRQEQRLAVGLYRVSTAEQGYSGLGLEAQRASVQGAAAKARGRVLGGDRGYRPAAGPDTAAAAQARRAAGERAAHRLVLEVERLKAEGVVSRAAIAQALTGRGVLTRRGGSAWTHTTVTRVLERAPG